MENKIDPVRFDKLYLIRQIINRLYQAEVTTASGLHEFVIVNDSDKTIELEELCGLIALYSDIPKDKEFSDLMESIVKRNWAEDKLKEQKDEGSISK